MDRCEVHANPPDGVLPCGCTTDVVEDLFARAGVSPPSGHGLWATIEAHLTPHLGPLEGVLHTPEESGSALTAVCLHQPGGERPTVDIATVGMSRKRMRPPRRLRRSGVPPRTELILRLPDAWRGSRTISEALLRPDNQWMLMLLKLLSQLPHAVRGYLGDARGLDARYRAVPLGGVPEIPFGGVLVADPRRFGAPIPVLRRAHRDYPAGRGDVQFLTVVPIFMREFAFALDSGVDALFARLEAENIDDVVPACRDPVA